MLNVNHESPEGAIYMGNVACRPHASACTLSTVTAARFSELCLLNAFLPFLLKASRRLQNEMLAFQPDADALLAALGQLNRILQTFLAGCMLFLAEIPAEGDGHSAGADWRHTVLRHISTIALQHQAGTCSMQQLH